MPIMETFKPITYGRVWDTSRRMPKHPVDIMMLRTGLSAEVKPFLNDIRQLSKSAPIGQGKRRDDDSTHTTLRPMIEPIALTGYAPKTVEDEGPGAWSATPIHIMGLVGFFENRQLRYGVTLFQNTLATHQTDISGQLAIGTAVQNSCQIIDAGSVPVSLTVDRKRRTFGDGMLQDAVLHGILSGKSYSPNLTVQFREQPQETMFRLRDSVCVGYEIGGRIHPHEQHFYIGGFNHETSVSGFISGRVLAITQQDVVSDIQYLRMHAGLKNVKLVKNPTGPDVYGLARKNAIRQAQRGDPKEEATITVPGPVFGVIELAIWTYGQGKDQVVWVMPVVRLDNGLGGKIRDAEIATAKDFDSSSKDKTNLVHGFQIVDTLSSGRDSDSKPTA